jgi:PAS domain S-box-containing protein
LKIKPDRIRQAWETFISQRNSSLSLHPLIAQSWERCYPILSPYQTVRLKKMSSDHLLQTQVSNFDLMSIARPIMEDIYQYIENTKTAVLLTERSGVVLDIIADSLIKENLRLLTIEPGAQLSESEMGTNAFALSVRERVPVQVSGAEHYRRQFHIFSDAAAPIFDLTGKPVGSFGLINYSRDAHPHTLGLVIAGARAIEAQSQADHLLFEQNSQLSRLNTILDTITDGILVWNQDGVIIHANPAATELVGMRNEDLYGHPLSQVLTFPAFIEEAIKEKQKITDVEAILSADGRMVTCIMSLLFVVNRKGYQAGIALLRQAQALRQLIQQQVGTRPSQTLENLVGKSPQIMRAYRLAKIAAPARASLMLRGEVGTGKNSLAHAVHLHSSRRTGPFIIFPCTSIPGELAVPELLGHEGSDGHSRPGKIELADGGTLFLQDVDALPLEAQTILLNVLELDIVQRMKSGRILEVDVRVIASTSASLEKLIAEEKFRADLYYRLSPFEIILPPLRERMEDVPLLVGQVLERLTRIQGRQIQMDGEAMNLLLRYSWPGNLRELEFVIERAVSEAGTSERILVEHLPEFIRKPIAWTPAEVTTRRVYSMDELERDAVLQAAEYCRGNVKKMAEMLGVGRTTLWRRIKQWEIPIQRYRGNGAKRPIR